MLSALIIVALKGMLLQLFQVAGIFRESSINCLVWMVTFLATVFLDIEYGLAGGILAAVLNLIWRSNRPGIQLVSVHKDNEAILVDERNVNVRYKFKYRYFFPVN